MSSFVSKNDATMIEESWRDLRCNLRREMPGHSKGEHWRTFAQVLWGVSDANPGGKPEESWEKVGCV